MLLRFVAFRYVAFIYVREYFLYAFCLLYCVTSTGGEGGAGGGGGGGGSGASSKSNKSNKTPRDANPTHSAQSPHSNSPMNRKSSISALFSKKTKPPLTDKQRHQAQMRWQFVRDNLKQIVKMKHNKNLHSSNADRKITRIVIDNGDLGRPGYGDEQTQCEIEVIGEFVPGEFVGHRAMRRGQPYAYSAIAMEPCKFYTLKRNDIMLMLRDEPDIALELQVTNLSFVLSSIQFILSFVHYMPSFNILPTS